MPLNRLENFIKNIEGRILYVNPNDLDSSDSINNDGNSLAQPFKTIQRALIEAARFSYVTGNNNDYIERTTVLVYPGEHVIDNRPGFAIKPDAGNPTAAKAVAPGGGETNAQDTFSLSLTSNFDIEQENNILYKFNSINGGVVIPRGTSIVGLDLRKTKVRPKYVPNPLDGSISSSAIFRVTGACYFWQFSFFDGDTSTTVYTNNRSFTNANDVATPTFSHHKLTCFEYADGVNIPGGYEITDLDMYYSKLSNAFNASADTKVVPDSDKYPLNPDGFAKRRPEYEIVGAFATDPISISDIISGDGSTPSRLVTVTTSKKHGLNQGTPIKVKGVTLGTNDELVYNASSLVASVESDTKFTYLITGSLTGFPASTSGTGLSVANATVTVETDTVEGASPYIFNCSLRSVYGMNGMNADGSKATGFRSMVVAQFTGISLQKDDRAFVKYNKENRNYDGISTSFIATGNELASGSSSLDPDKVYHLDSDAIYRNGWDTAHVRITNDAILQIVSVFAIGYNRHFSAESGGDASITNSNSNFGQLSLTSDGFKKTAFDKDNTAYITSIITPKSVEPTESNIDWFKIDGYKTSSVGISSHLYLDGFTNQNDAPPSLVAGYRIGAKEVSDVLYVPVGKPWKDPSDGGEVTETAIIQMTNGDVGGVSVGTNVSLKSYEVTSGPTDSKFTIGSHGLQNGENIRIFSDDADLPENINAGELYYAITNTVNTSRTDGVVLSTTQIQLASSFTDAENGDPITVYGGTKLHVESRVHDKEAGKAGSPIQYDTTNGQWYIHVDADNSAYTNIKAETNPLVEEGTSQATYIKRIEDNRSLDDKIYKLRVVVPKEVVNGKNPEESFIIQSSSSTGALADTDFTITSIDNSNFAFNRNPSYIGFTTVSGTNVVTVTTEQPHNLNSNDVVIVKNVTSTTNTAGVGNSGYNGTFTVTDITSNTFKYSTTDTTGTIHNVGTFTNDVRVRNTSLPRFERSDLLTNYYIYRNETISPYIEGQQDGIYHIFALNAGNQVPSEYTNLKYSQNVVDLYPQLDRDNTNDNPSATVSKATRNPIGDVTTNYQKSSVTRETADKFIKDFGAGDVITSVVDNGTSADISLDKKHTFSGISTGTISGTNTGYTDGTYQNVKLLIGNADPTVGTWRGATAKVVVASNSVSSVEVTNSGGGYSAGDLKFDKTTTLTPGGASLTGTNAAYTIASGGIVNSVGDVVQTTGIGTKTDGYYRISSVPNDTVVSVAKTSGDALPYAGQYVLGITPSVSIVSTEYNSVVGITTVNTSLASHGHGLVAGNNFRILDSSNNNKGDYTVVSVASTNQFTFKNTTTVGSVASGYILKHGMSANNAISDREDENLGSRGFSIFDNDYLTLQSIVTTGSKLTVDLTNSEMNRFPLGSYIQIDDEIMRVSSSVLSGAGNNELSVIRGVFGSVKSSHNTGSLIRKIKAIPVEFRRPSILRASGHTFEYVGYGPGNYSTGLPQVQVKTLNEREEFLVQSQERSCGAVVYTGMNNRGDFFIGNKRVSSTTGQERTFDAPIPTVTGEDPSRLSVILDEVICKERIIVEGGKSNRILSQFDGPVTFNGDVKLNKGFSVGGLKVEEGGKLEIDNAEFSNATFNGDIHLKDGIAVAFGGNSADSADLRIFHDADSSKSVINDVGDGNLELQTGGNTKLTINSDGIDITGISTDDGATHNGDVNFTGALYNAIWDKSENSLIFKDNAKANFGTTGTGDLSIYHNSSTVMSHIEATTNSLEISVPYGKTISLKTGADNLDTIKAHSLAGTPQANWATLHFNGDEHLRTNSTGVKITGELEVTDDITAFSASDKTLKDNITPIPNALDKVISISGNTFNWNEKSSKEGQGDTGVIAQEVEKLDLPGVTTTRDDGTKAVRYEKLVPLLIEAIKELKNEVDELKKGK